jgi:hypothetical protein
MIDGFTASEIQTGETSIFVRSSGDGLVHGRRIACPILALWGAGGPLDTWYVEEGGRWHSGRRWVKTTFGDMRWTPGTSSRRKPRNKLPKP